MLGHHLLKRLCALALQGAGLRGRAYFAFCGTTAFAHYLDWAGDFRVVLFGNRLARLNGRSVPADVAYELFDQGVLNHLGMHALHQFTGGELF